jgi:hypothetical protein
MIVFGEFETAREEALMVSFKEPLSRHSPRDTEKVMKTSG